MRKAGLRQWIEKRAGQDTQARRAAWNTLGAAVGVAVNLLLALCKLLVGMRCGSVAATADAANSFSDAGGSVLSLLSVRLARRQATERNPFGFGRAEYLGALGVGALILWMGVQLLLTGVRAIAHPQPLQFEALPFLTLVAGVLVKALLGVFYRRLGTPLDSAALLAAAKDAWSDCLSSGAVALSFLTARFAGWQLDGYIGVLVSLLVLKTGWDVARDTVTRLLGGKMDRALGERIIARVRACGAVLGVHDLVLHDYGPGRCMATIHAQVDAGSDLMALHEEIDGIERAVYDEMGVSLSIHLDPVAQGDPQSRSLEEALRGYLQGYAPPMELQDFRALRRDGRLRLLFDVDAPPSFRQGEKLEADIRAFVRTLAEDAECEIRLDKEYYHA